jgi:hypothetical protein
MEKRRMKQIDLLDVPVGSSKPLPTQEEKAERDRLNKAWAEHEQRKVERRRQWEEEKRRRWESRGK